jgi:hypothetical protein
VLSTKKDMQCSGSKKSILFKTLKYPSKRPNESLHRGTNKMNISQPVFDGRAEQGCQMAYVFSNQKSRFGKILEGLPMEDVGKLYGR